MEAVIDLDAKYALCPTCSRHLIFPLEREQGCCLVCRPREVADDNG